MSTCQECEKNEVYIHFGEEHLCLDCFNGRMAKELGVEAESYPEGVAIRDGLGEVHHFRLRKRLDPIGIFMEAEEPGSAGYQFKVQGDLYGNQGELLLQLIAKAERGMAESYVERRQFPNGQSYDSLRNDRLAGRVRTNRSQSGLTAILLRLAYGNIAIGTTVAIKSMRPFKIAPLC